MSFSYDSLGHLLTYRGEIQERFTSLYRASEIIDGLLTSGVAYNQDLLIEEKTQIDRESRRLEEIYQGVQSRIKELESDR